MIGTILSLSTLSYVSLFGYVMILYMNTNTFPFSSYVDPHMFSRKEEPETVYATAEIEQFGVIWKGKYGMWVDPELNEELDPYTYVYGPFCPHDDQPLGVGIVREQSIRAQAVWMCDSCDRTYTYPRTEVVNGRVIESEMRRRFEEKSEKPVEV